MNTPNKRVLIQRRRFTRRQRNVWAARSFIVLLLCSIGLFLAAETVAAAPADMDDQDISDGLFSADYNRLPDDSKAYYQVDLSKEEAGEEQSAGEKFMDGITNFNPIKNAAEDTTNEFLNVIVNLGLKMNMMMSNLMIGVLNFAFETDIINAWINNMDGVVQKMAGVSGLTVTGGLFGSLLGFAIIMTGAVFLYQVAAKKATLASMNTLFKSVLALAAAFILFANFAPLMTGMNEISTQISSTMLSGTSTMVTGDNRTDEEIREQVSSNLWNEFIGRPYMILQYGTDDVEKIGEERVLELLAMKPGEDRAEFVSEVEVGERGNETMTPASLMDRVSFTALYSVVNMLVSIPIYLLALAMIIFQLWFLMVAFLAPFVMVQAAFPGQFPVLRRYAIELMYPLVCKVIATVATLFIFTLGFSIYSIEIVGGLSRYLISAIMQFGLFAVFFVFRKRIAMIMGAGERGPFDSLRGDINGLKSSMDGAASKFGEVGKMAAHVTLAAATGGSSAAVTTAAAAAAKAASSEPAPEETAQPNQHSAPLAKVSDVADPAETPAKENASAPIARMSDHSAPSVESAENTAPSEKTAAMLVKAGEVPENPAQETTSAESTETAAASAPFAEMPADPVETDPATPGADPVENAAAPIYAEPVESVESPEMPAQSTEAAASTETAAASTPFAEMPAESVPSVESPENPAEYDASSASYEMPAERAASFEAAEEAAADPVEEVEPVNDLSTPLVRLDEMEDEGDVPIVLTNAEENESEGENNV